MNGLDDLMAEVAETQRAELRRLHLEPEVARRIAAAESIARGGAVRGRGAGWRFVAVGATGLAVAAAVLLAVTPAGRRLAGRLGSSGADDAPPLSFAVASGGASHRGGVGEGLAGRVGEPVGIRLAVRLPVGKTPARRRATSLDGGDTRGGVTAGRRGFHALRVPPQARDP